MLQLWIVIEHFHMGLKNQLMTTHKLRQADKIELVKDMFLSKLHYYTRHLRVKEESDAIMLLCL